MIVQSTFFLLTSNSCKINFLFFGVLSRYFQSIKFFISGWVKSYFSNMFVTAVLRKKNSTPSLFCSINGSQLPFYGNKIIIIIILKNANSLGKKGGERGEGKKENSRKFPTYSKSRFLRSPLSPSLWAFCDIFLIWSLPSDPLSGIDFRVVKNHRKLDLNYCSSFRSCYYKKINKK